MQSDLTRQRDVRCRTGDKQIEISGRDSPRMALDVIVGERSPIESHDDVLGLAGIQAYSLEALQFFYWARDGSVPIANVNLRNVRSGASARVGDVERDADLLIR